MFYTSRKNISPQPFNPLRKLHQHLIWGMAICTGLIMVSIVTVIVGT